MCSGLVNNIIVLLSPVPETFKAFTPTMNILLYRNISIRAGDQSASHHRVPGGQHAAAQLQQVGTIFILRGFLLYKFPDFAQRISNI